MRIGVDLGGTKIEAIAIDESGNELLRRRVATPVEHYDEILGAIRNLVLAAENELSKKVRSESDPRGPYHRLRG